jgi:hypothetical protein
MRFDISLAFCDKIPVGTNLFTQHNSIISRSLVWHLCASEVEKQRQNNSQDLSAEDIFEKLLDGGIVVI